MDVSKTHGSVGHKMRVGHHGRGHRHDHLRSQANSAGGLPTQSGQVSTATPSDVAPGTAPTQPADASASIRYKRTERVGLVIRTQDGDTVRLRFSTSERLKANMTEGAEGEGDAPEISLSARTNSKISMSIKGDLNAEELAAIQDTFNQATALADQFFAGGLPDAFAGAEALNIDGEQLARVSFKATLKQHLTYTSRGYAPALPPELPVGSEDPADQGTLGGGGVPDSTLPSLPVQPSAVDEFAPLVEDSDGAGTPVTDEESEANKVEAPEIDNVDPPRLFDPAQIIGDFLGRLVESLGNNPDGGGSATLDVSLKIRIFQSALITLSEIQPTDEPGLPELVPETLDAVADLQQPPVDAVA